MRFRPPLLLIVLLVLPVSAGLSQPLLSQAPDDRLIVPGQRIGKWSLEMTIRDLAGISGPLISHISPFREAYPLDSIHGGLNPVLVEVEWKIGFVAATRTSVTELRRGLPHAKVEYLYLEEISPVGADEFWTPEGLHSGSSTKQLLAAYGKPTSSTRGGRHWQRLVYDEIGLAAATQGEKITYFIIFRPGTGRMLWRLSQPVGPQLVSNALILVLVLAGATWLMLIRRRRARA